jgi:hypothetical protein
LAGQVFHGFYWLVGVSHTGPEADNASFSHRGKFQREPLGDGPPDFDVSLKIPFYEIPFGSSIAIPAPMAATAVRRYLV